MEIKDSGHRQTFSTGAQRDTPAGKGMPELISPIFINGFSYFLRHKLTNTEGTYPNTMIRVSRAIDNLYSWVDGQDDIYLYGVVSCIQQIMEEEVGVIYPRMCVSPLLLERFAIHMEAGAEKYEARNWEKGIPIMRYFGAAVRHLYQYLSGNREEDHLSAAVFNIQGIVHTEEMIRRNVLPETLRNGKPNYKTQEDPIKVSIELNHEQKLRAYLLWTRNGGAMVGWDKAARYLRNECGLSALDVPYVLDKIAEEFDNA